MKNSTQIGELNISDTQKLRVFSSASGGQPTVWFRAMRLKKWKWRYAKNDLRVPVDCFEGLETLVRNAGKVVGAFKEL